MRRHCTHVYTNYHSIQPYYSPSYPCLQSIGIMQSLEAPLQRVLDFLNTQYTNLSRLSSLGVPMQHPLRQFMAIYTQYIDALILAMDMMVGRGGASAGGRERMLGELVQVMREKERVSRQAWVEVEQGMEAVMDGIDRDRGYYGQLLMRVQLLGEGTQDRVGDRGGSGNGYFRKYADIVGRPKSKHELYARLYDTQYSQQQQGQEPRQKSTGKIVDRSEQKNKKSQLSPYKIVNPRFSPRKASMPESPKTPSPALTRNNTKQIITATDRNSKNLQYRRYKQELFKDMRSHVSQQPIIATPVKKFNYQSTKMREQETAQTHRYNRTSESQTERNHENTIEPAYQTDGEGNSRRKGKKYQYLFEEEPFVPDVEPIASKNMRRNIFEDYIQQATAKKMPKFKDNTNDSLQQLDYLGKQLQIDIPRLFPNEKEPDLQQILTDSIMSSKPCEDQGIDHDSETDSLEEMERKICETGKFQAILATQLASEHNILRIRPIAEEMDRLDISFGKN